ncbi:MAG: translation initiation factor IF-2 [Planctomycetota bacterium]
MATKRIHHIAKELGVKSKAIVEKCQQEGIPDDVVKNHMSVVGAGLEATIRDWFDTGHGGGTAVETAEKVDLKQVKAPPKKLAEPTPADSSPEDTDVAAREPSVNGESKPAVAAELAPPAAAARAPAPSEAPPAPPPGPVAAPAPLPKTESAPPISGPGSEPGSGPDSGPDSGPVAPAPDEPDRPRVAAKQNVPDRPKDVAPAGPQLDKKAPVRLSGPKVVRVEAPERLEPPRPRRNTGPRFDAPGGGMGVPMGPAEGAGDGRSPRRGGGGGGAGRGGPGGGGGGGGRRKGRGESGGGFTEQDLAEREARRQRSGGFLKQRRNEQLRRQGGHDKPQTPAQRGGKVTISEPFTIKELSAATGVKGAEIVKKLFMQGVMANINSGIETEVAQEIMIDYDIELEVVEAKTAEQQVSEQFEDREIIDERPRGPVVTILGHVDHGKTSLLDKIRDANVAAGEAGGITQATSAFRVPLKIGDEDRTIVFLDTPGHEAFTSMRARGANMTDIVVLVVAADDGVMPQTAESISHAKAAGVPIVVALNKIDKPEATDSNIQKILGQLAEHELNPVDWGGETEVVRTSAIKGEGIQELLEILDLQAQVLELKADFGGAGRGTVIEARTQEGRGSVANLLLQEGELKVGQFVVAGRAFGRVRDITTDRGERMKSATPPMPVQISGIDGLPDAGDKFYIVDTLKQAEQAAQQRRDTEREAQLAAPKMTTLDSMFSAMADKAVKEIRVVLKADVQGSVDVLRGEIEKVQSDEVRCRVLHSAIGGVTESDVLLAEASEAVIVGFNVIPSGKARNLAEQKGVQIRPYQVIYDIVEDMTKAAEGLLAPELRQEVLGHAEVRKVFKVSKVGMIAGCYVTDGTVQRDALIRVTRGDIVIENDRVLEQLKRVKDDVKEVRANTECGMKIAGYDDIKEGDILECYKQVEVARKL